MSKRLQVVLSDADLEGYYAVARQAGLTLSEWVRQTLRAASRSGAQGNPLRKLAAVRTAFEHAFPTADVDRMLAEIERGYSSEESE